MPRKISEALNRKEMIDPQLEHAGWFLRDHSKVMIEIPVDGQTMGDMKTTFYGLSSTVCFAGVVARVESLRGRMGESTRQVDGLFESLLAESFGG